MACASRNIFQLSNWVPISLCPIMCMGSLQSGRGAVPAPDEFGTNKIQGGITPPLRKPILGQIVAYFKYQSTKKINSIDHSGVITKIWQRNYYEHIIRDNDDMERIWNYIESNPIVWENDDENPIRL